MALRRAYNTHALAQSPSHCCVKAMGNAESSFIALREVINAKAPARMASDPMPPSAWSEHDAVRALCAHPVLPMATNEQFLTGIT